MFVEFFLEEPSAEAFLQRLVPKILPEGTEVAFRVFSGKSDLLRKLPQRLKGMHWIPESHRIVVLVDEDRQDCLSLKEQLEAAALEAGLLTKSAANGKTFKVLNRIAVEELEAWFLGDLSAIQSAYPRFKPSYVAAANRRDPDAVKGGTCEALERALQKAGYYTTGLPKIEVARKIADHIDLARNTSRSFRHFVRGISAL